MAGHAALYAEPMFVINSSPFDVPGADNNTFMLGLGGRLRLRPSLYVVGEITPRLAGFDPGVNQMSFGVEGRAGGHLFQLNFSNGFGTTLGQIASGTFKCRYETVTVMRVRPKSATKTVMYVRTCFLMSSG